MSFLTFSEDSEGVSFNLRRLDFTIEDMFKMESESGSLRKFVRVTVKAQMKKSEIENYKMWSYKEAGVERRGRGSLTFSDKVGDGVYLHFDDMYITSLSETGTTWTEWGMVEAVFSNETGEEESLGIMRFENNGNAFDIYNGVVSVISSQIRRSVSTISSYNGSFMQDVGHDFVRINLSGIVLHDSCEFPASIIEAFEPQSLNIDGSFATIPLQQDLTSFLPDLTDIGYANMFIETANVTWIVEKRCLNINVVFVGPPQKIEN